ncbi:MAG: TIR domain-containing protein [Chloroflexi bacterium]|nr:TIR domain-containing protein [Chloroflexota bacterium]
MADRRPYLYDVFISYHPEDADWVLDWLAPRLRQAGFRVATEDDFVAGAPRIQQIAAFIEQSYRTIAVITPAWVTSSWNQYEASITITEDPDASRRKLIPLLLKPAAVPAPIERLVRVDFTAEKRWDRQFSRLVRDLWDVIPPPPLPLPRRGGPDLAKIIQRWRWWLRYHRWRARTAAVALFVAWVLLFTALRWPPFQMGVGWQALSFREQGAWRLTRAGNVLLASSSTSFLGCEGAGLWRSADEGASWADVPVPALKFDRASQGCVLAAINSFASTPASPETVYASTTDVGLLRSTDAGLTWARVASETLPAELWQVVIAPGASRRLLVAAQRGGVFRSTDGGTTFQRLDGSSTCPQGAGRVGSLSPSLSAGSLLATTGIFYVGTDSASTGTSSAGLYASDDGGDCWEVVDRGDGRYGYVAMAAVPGRQDELALLVYDAFHAQHEPAYLLWQFRRGQGRLRRLWATSNAVRTLFVDADQAPRWYTVTDLGAIVRGPMDRADAGGPLPPILRCLLPPTCDTDMAADFDALPPLLLANDQVYRLGMVPWYRRLWP